MSDYVAVEGGRLFFEDSGEGPAILFLHSGVADLRMWDEQSAALGSDFRCIRFDQRGFGRTENKGASFDATADVEAVLDHLGIGEVHIVGNSLGGMVAVDFALAQPNRVSSMVLVAPGIGGWRSEATGEEVPIEQEMIRLEEAQEWDSLVEAELHMWLDGPRQQRGRVAGEVREKLRQMCRGAYGRGEPEADRIPIDPPSLQRLDEIHCPVLVMIGDWDVFTVREAAGHLVANVKNATLSTYEGAAHMISLEQPARFNAELRMFLGKAPSVISP